MELDLASRGSKGGGVYVHSGGVANFEGCNIHDNTVTIVCLQLELSLNFQPSPRWNVTRAHGWQVGGGLCIAGMATLTNSNVYSNQAGRVCSPFELSSSALMERYACSWLAGRRGTLHRARNLGHGNADRHQRVR